MLNTQSSFSAPDGAPENTTAKGFHYMMLFDNNPVSGAERLSDALRKLAQL